MTFKEYLTRTKTHKDRFRKRKKKNDGANPTGTNNDTFIPIYPTVTQPAGGPVSGIGGIIS